MRAFVVMPINLPEHLLWQAALSIQSASIHLHDTIPGKRVLRLGGRTLKVCWGRFQIPDDASDPMVGGLLIPRVGESDEGGAPHPMSAIALLFSNPLCPNSARVPEG